MNGLSSAFTITKSHGQAIFNVEI